MGDLKSLCSLWTDLATNHRYARFISRRDIATFNERAQTEGLYFLTNVLPNIGKALDTFHSTKTWTAPDGFSCEKNRYAVVLGNEPSCDVVDVVGIPHFLGRCIKSALFGSSQAVDCLRQMTLIFYKLEVTYDQNTVEAFIQRFQDVDSSLFGVHSLGPKNTEHIDSMRKIIARILCNSNPYDIRPRHGSGATSNHTEPWDKYHGFNYFDKLDRVYPYADHFFLSPTHLCDDLDVLERSTIGDPCARICLVPKDSRGPRVISCEPTELMYIQQGLMRLLYAELETNYLTAGSLNFTDQSINKSLARDGSIWDHLATIDLRDASDRVSLDLVRLIFPANWVECFEACRSEFTLLPNGVRLELKKFAPMGSSCCFPVEALIFWTSAFASLRRLGCPESPYVYGDDIIVPSDFYRVVCDDLESIGLEVNTSKSFYSGPFRESCGGDYHLGRDVTPIRCRKAIDSSPLSLVSTCELINLLIAKFGVDMPESAIDNLMLYTGYCFPSSERSIPLTLRRPVRSYNDAFFRRRYNKHLQRYEHRILQTSPLTSQRREPNWFEALRFELSKVPSDASLLNGLPVIRDALEPGFYSELNRSRLVWQWVALG